MIFFRGRLCHEMNLVGKTREQIRAALASKSREELLDLICSLATVEQLYKPAQIAGLSCLNKRAVLRDIRDGKFGDYYCRAENSIAVPASGVNAWRRGFCVPGNRRRERADDAISPEIPIATFKKSSARSRALAKASDSLDMVSVKQSAEGSLETGLSGENIRAIGDDRAEGSERRGQRA